MPCVTDVDCNSKYCNSSSVCSDYPKGYNPPSWRPSPTDPDDLPDSMPFEWNWEMVILVVISALIIVLAIILLIRGIIVGKRRKTHQGLQFGATYAINADNLKLQLTSTTEE